MFKTRAVSDLNSFKNVPLVFYFNRIVNNALKKEKAVKITNATLIKYYANWLNTAPREGGRGATQQSFIQGGSAPWTNPSFYIPFLTEKVPLTGKWYAFHIPNKRCIPLTAVNALSFKYEILAKLCLKPENGTPCSALKGVPPPPGVTQFLKESIFLRNTVSKWKKFLQFDDNRTGRKRNCSRKVSFPLHNSSSSLDNKHAEHAYWILTS